MSRRPVLDGLRALATLAVILDHASVGWADGAGTWGVTLFFVLSGFLITRLLVTERERTGRIDLRAFYLRRVRRLVPPLLVFLTVVSALLYLSGEHPWGVLLALTFTSDLAWLFPVPLHLVGHTWSLSLEEQFYALWPALLVVLGRRHARLLLPGLAVLALLVTANRMALGLEGASLGRSFYGPDTRSDALMVGCILALLIHRLPVHRLAPAGAVAGVVLLACTPLHRELLVFLLVPITLAAAVLVAWAWSTTNGGVLGWQPVRQFGRISYAVYLWHLPVSELLLNLGASPWLNAGLTLVVSTVLAAASWRWIESPLLRARQPVRPRRSATCGETAGSSPSPSAR